MTLLVDQNACSSPHVVFWLGKKDKIKKNFGLSFKKQSISMNLILWGIL